MHISHENSLACGSLCRMKVLTLEESLTSNLINGNTLMIKLKALRIPATSRHCKCLPHVLLYDCDHLIITVMLTDAPLLLPLLLLLATAVSAAPPPCHCSSHSAANPQHQAQTPAPQSDCCCPAPLAADQQLPDQQGAGGGT